MVRPSGFEPPTFCSGDKRSIAKRPARFIARHRCYFVVFDQERYRWRSALGFVVFGSAHATCRLILKGHQLGINATIVKSMVSVDFFTVPTVRFQVLYVFLVLAHDRRRIVHFAVTAHPTRGMDAAANAGGQTHTLTMERLQLVRCGR